MNAMDAVFILRAAGRRARLLLPLAVLGAVCAAAPAAAAPVFSDPVRTLTVPGDGHFCDVATTLAVSGGVAYSAGYVYDATGGDDVLVQRWDEEPLGWTVQWDGPAGRADTASDMAVRGGAVYVVGTTQKEAGDTDLLILKYTTAGTFVWVRTYPVLGDAWEFANRIAIDRAGNLIVAGTRTQAAGASPASTIIVKYTPDGRRIWSRSLALLGSDITMADLCLDSFGNAYVVGRTSRGSHNAFVAAYTPGGVRRWVRFYDGAGHRTDTFEAVTRSPLGGVYVAGSEVGTDGHRNAVVARYTAAGALVKVRRLGVGDGRDQWLNDVATDSLGRIAVCGSWQRPDPDFFVALLNASGGVRWSFTYDGATSDDEATVLAIDSSNRVCAAGDITDDPGLEQAGAFAFSSAGLLRWYCRWPDPAVGPGSMQDLVTYRSSDVWACGSTWAGAAEDYDQVLLRWEL